MSMGMVQNARRHSKHLILGSLLGLMLLAMAGCSTWHQPGESATERSLRHNRALRHNYQSMVEDIDKVFLINQPSRLGDHTLP